MLSKPTEFPLKFYFFWILFTVFFQAQMPHVFAWTAAVALYLGPKLMVTNKSTVKKYV